MYRVLEICRHTINYSNDRDYSISNLKLQKILYFIQAAFLVDKNEPCFSEPIEAWDLGPVVPDAYHEYKQFGSGDIPRISHYFQVNKEDIWKSLVIEYKDNVISDDDTDIINSVVDMCSEYSATDLVAITHRQAPWLNAYKKGQNVEISIESIKEYFDE